MSNRNYHLLTYNPWTDWKPVKPATAAEIADREKRMAEAAKKFAEKHGK